jgi:hypothetical protein
LEEARRRGSFLGRGMSCWERDFSLKRLKEVILRENMVWVLRQTLGFLEKIAKKAKGRGSLEVHFFAFFWVLRCGFGFKGFPLQGEPLKLMWGAHELVVEF